MPSAPITEPIDKDSKPENDEAKSESDESETDDDEGKAEDSLKGDDTHPENKDELIIFTGLVSISVSDETSVSTISADKIIHNKTRETLTAIGNVVYTRKIGSDEGESFKGDSLIFNIKKLEGVFVDGIISQAPAKKSRPF